MVKYWLKVLLLSENCIIKVIHKYSVEDVNLGKKKRAFKVKMLLYNYGFGYMWEAQDSITDGNLFVQYFKQ